MIHDCYDTTNTHTLFQKRVRGAALLLIALEISIYFSAIDGLYRDEECYCTYLALALTNLLLYFGKQAVRNLDGFSY
jgi:hypothetical protein